MVVSHSSNLVSVIAESCVATDARVCSMVMLDGDPLTCTAAGACSHTPAATNDASCSGNANDGSTDCAANFAAQAPDFTEAACTGGAGDGCTYTAAQPATVEACAATDLQACSDVSLPTTAGTCTAAGACTFIGPASIMGVLPATGI